MDKDLIEKYLDEFFKELQHTPGPWRPQGVIVAAPSHMEVCKLTSTDLHSNMIVKNEDQVTPANAVLIASAPSSLRTLCRTYLTLLVKFAWGQNSTTNSIRISMNGTLASLRNEIANATGLEGEHVQDTFENLATMVRVIS